MVPAFISVVIQNKETVKSFVSFVFSQLLLKVTSIFPEHHLNLNSFPFKKFKFISTSDFWLRMCKHLAPQH